MNLKGKRILLQAPLFFDLHIQLIKEIEERGAIVHYYKDELFLFTPKWKSGRLLKLKKLIYSFYNPSRKKAYRFIKENKNTYDIYICINGFCFCDILHKYLKKKNSHLISILYLWDSCKEFNFIDTFHYFEKVFSFDIIDSKSYNINYLPLFWVPNNLPVCKDKYDLFFVGSLHSDRYSFLKKMLVINPSISLYLKLYVDFPKYVWITYIKYYTSSILHSNNLNKIRYHILKGEIKDDFITRVPISRDEFDHNMKLSRCILDIALPSQSGVSNRVIGALAMGKKIITTNSYIKDTSFYDPKRILIINRDTPHIDRAFINNESGMDNTENKEIFKLRIDNWLSQLLS